MLQISANIINGNLSPSQNDLQLAFESVCDLGTSADNFPSGESKSLGFSNNEFGFSRSLSVKRRSFT
jgi:hypothetical protein